MSAARPTAGARIRRWARHLGPAPRPGAGPAPRPGAGVAPRPGAAPGPRSGANPAPRSAAVSGPRSGALVPGLAPRPGTAPLPPRTARTGPTPAATESTVVAGAAPRAPRPRRGAATVRAWAEQLRLPAVLTVPGDVLAGTAAAGKRPGPSTVFAVGAAVCLYEAGMVLNDWADRDEDAVARPERPLPSGRIRPPAALAAAGVLSAAGLALAACAGRRACAVAAPLAATVWAYDLKLKHTAAAPAAMAAARFLDLLLGAAAAGGPLRPALAPALVLGTHTSAVTLVSRHEAQGGSSAAPLLGLAATAAVTAAVARRTADLDAPVSGVPAPAIRPPTSRAAGPFGPDVVRTALAAGYAATVARPLAHAALNPSAMLTQRAVGAGIRATIALQGALTARAGAPGTGLATAALAPAAARLARTVSIT